MQISSEHPVTITKRTPDKVKIIFFIEYLLILRRNGISEIILFPAPFTIYTKTRERNNTKSEKIFGNFSDKINLWYTYREIEKNYRSDIISDIEKTLPRACKNQRFVRKMQIIIEGEQSCPNF